MISRVSLVKTVNAILAAIMVIEPILLAVPPSVVQAADKKSGPQPSTADPVRSPWAVTSAITQPPGDTPQTTATVPVDAPARTNPPAPLAQPAWHPDARSTDLDNIPVLSPDVKALLNPVNQTTSASRITFNVNDANDTADANTSDGKCATATNTCTLRAAVQQSNTLTSAQTVTINLQAETYELNSSLTVTNPSNILLPHYVDIKGAGVDQTFIDGQYDVTVFANEASRLTIMDLTIQHGYAGAAGGADAIDSTGPLTLANCAIEHNNRENEDPTGHTAVSVDYSSQVVQDAHPNDHYFDMSNCTIRSNNTETGIDNVSGGAARIVNSSISGNTGVGILSTSLLLIGTTINGNDGGGIYGVEGGFGIIKMMNSTIFNNGGPSGGDGIAVAAVELVVDQ